MKCYCTCNVEPYRDPASWVRSTSSSTNSTLKPAQGHQFERTRRVVATYEEFDACPRCVCNVVGQLVAIAAEALSTSSECHADNCVVCAAEDDREPPRAVDDITRRLAFLLDFIQKPPP